jgi:serine/threonine protein kinase/Flp pilus assembly protein TadD
VNTPAADLKSIFDKALELTEPAERACYLAAACGENARLRAEVESLLGALDKAGSFLETPALPSERGADEPIHEGAGTMIGACKLLEQIGEGGFGVVFMAEQQHPVRRKVALKVLKPGMDTRQVIARFEAERQALALMDHPNIAHVFDGGETAGGRPYFIMELVKGIPITEYCDQAHLTPRERLELFLPICHAMQHAHQKGIIHRDLKPSNVLVTLHDGIPVPKIIDFGISKALGQQLTDKTLYTGFAQMVGTPLYMSPEQAALSGLDVDTRSDIYALGVLLYELLTGTTPFDKERLHQAGYDELRRIIREEEPPKPSTRMSTLGQAATTASLQRKSDPKRLSQLFRGELDWIVMKCLEKDRNRRYETANALALDIQRYLHDEAVQACPPSPWYRFRKFARRNKAVLGTVALVSAILIVAVVLLTLSNLRINDEKSQKDEALQQALANEKTADAERRRAQENLIKACEAVDQMLTRVAEEQLAYVPQMEQVRRKLLEDARTFYDGFLKNNTTDPALRLESGKAQRRLGDIHHMFRDSAKAEKAYRCAITIFREITAGQASNEAEYQHEVAVTYIGLGEVLQRAGRGEEAELLLRRAARIETGLLAQEPKCAKYWETLGRSYTSLGLVLRGRREAIEPLREAVAIHKKLVADFSAVTEYRFHLASSCERLGDCLWNLGSEEAEVWLRKAIDLLQQLLAESPGAYAYRERLGATRQLLAGYLTGAGRVREPEQVLRDAHDVLTKLAKDFPNARGYEGDFGHICKRLAYFSRSRREFTEACSYFRQAIYHFRRRIEASPDYGEGLESLGGTFNDLASTLLDLGDQQAAEKVCREAVDYLQKLHHKEPGVRVELGHCLWQLAGILLSTSRRAEAEMTLHEARTLFEALSAEHPKAPSYRLENGQGLWQLAQALVSAGQPADAEKAYRDALVIFEKLAADFPTADLEYHRRLASNYDALAELLRKSKRPQDAIDVSRQAVAFYERLAAKHPGDRNIRFECAKRCAHLGSILRETAHANEGEQAYQRSLALYEQLSADFPGEPVPQAHESDTLLTFGHLLRSNRRHQEAERVYRRSLDIGKRVAKMSPADLWHAHMPAACLHHLGDLLLETNRPTNAIEEYQRARDEYKKLLSRFPEPSYVQAEFATLLGNLARALQETGQARQCNKAYGEAEKAYRELVAVRLNSVSQRNDESARWHLGLAHDMLANLLKASGRLAEAAESLQSAVVVWQRLVADFNKEDHRWRLGLDHEALGSWLKDLGRLDDAAEAYRQGLSDWQKLADEFHKEDHRNHLSSCHAGLTEVLIGRARQVENDAKLSKADGRAKGQAYRAEARQLLRDGIKRGFHTAHSLNQSAWRLATDPNPDKRDAAWALEVAKLAVERDPDNGVIVNTLGVAYYRAGQWKNSIETLKEADALYQGQFFSTDALFIAMALWQMGEKDAARKWYKAAARWMEKFQDDEENRRFRAEAATLLGLPQPGPKAARKSLKNDLEIYTLITDAFPEAAWAYLTRGRAYSRQGDVERAQADYREALSLFTHAIDRRPKNAAMWNNRGNASFSLRQWDKAAFDYSKAIELQPANWVLSSNRASAYAELAQWDKAVADFAKATEHKAAGATACYLHALVRVQLGDRDSYRKACALILERFGTQKKAPGVELAVWACVLAADGVTDYPGLLRWAENTFGADAKTFAGLNTTGVVLYRAGRFDDAVKRLNDARAAHKPADEQRTTIAYTCYFLAMAHHRLGHSEEARRWLDQANRHGAEKKPAETSKTPVPWNRRLTVRLLRCEAERLLKGNKD